MAAEDPRFLLHFKTLAKFKEKLADGVISTSRHLCFIADEQLIWCRGEYYTNGNKLDNISTYLTDWEIKQTTPTSLVLALKGKIWDEPSNSFKDTSKDITLELATRLLAGLMSAADKTKVDGLNESNISNIVFAATPTQVDLTVSKDNGLSPDIEKVMTFPTATSTTAGTLSASDKTKLDRMAGSNYKLTVSKKDSSSNTITLTGTNPIDGSEITTSAILTTATKSEAGLMTSDLLETIDDKFTKMINFASFNKAAASKAAETTFISATTDQDVLDMYTEGNISLHMHQADTTLGIKHDNVNQTLATPAPGEVISGVTSDTQGHLLTTSKTDLINRAKMLDHNITISLVDANGHNGVTGSVITSMSSDVINIETEVSSLDASKITTGILDINRIPQGALERLTIVGTLAEAQELVNKGTVQDGDSIQVSDTGTMYYVRGGALTEYTAGSAARVPWSGVTDKPTSIALTGDVTGNVSLSAGALTLSATVTDNSHDHTIGNVSGLQGVLDSKVNSVVVGGSGNAIDSASIAGTVLTLTKGNTFNNYVHPTGSEANTAMGLYKISTDGLSHVLDTAAVTKSDIVALGIPSVDTVYTHPVGSSASATSGFYKFSTDATSHVSSVTAVTKSDVTSLGIPAQDTVYSHPTGATPSKTLGLYKFSTDSLSHISTAVDVTKADIVALGIPGQDSVYTHPTGTAPSIALGLYKVQTDANSHVSQLAAVTKSDITALGLPSSDTTYSEGTGISISGTTINCTVNRNTLGIDTDDNVIFNKVSAPAGFWKESDKRLKSDITNLSHTLDQICEIPTVSFTKDSIHQIGTLAQSVEDAGFPELVDEGYKVADEVADSKIFDRVTSGGIEFVKVKRVEYEMLSIVAIEGIKLLRDEVNALKAEIALLKNNA